MKITIYELLGLIKDGKAPKKIIYRNKIWEYTEIHKDYYNDMWSLLENQIDVITNYFDDEIEIIEEEKCIEKMNLHVDDWCTPTQCDIELSKKIDEIIDEINRLKKGNDDLSIK